MEYAGENIGKSYDNSRGYSVNREEFDSSLFSNSYYSVYDCWNVEQISSKKWQMGTQGGTYHYSYKTFLNQLSLIFSSGDISVNDYILTAEALQSYCEAYDKSFEKGHLQINEHDFSADLFADEVDEGRTRGYNLREFDITNPDDYWDIRSYDSTHNWWQKFKDYGFGTITTNDDYSDISPIQMLKAEDFLVSNVADHLKIHKDDVSKLRDYYNNCVADKNEDGKPDNAVFLFRYAQTDYEAHDVTVKELSSGNTTSAELRQGTQFFDFDILTMTFNKAGELTTLGVVSSPVDHWTAYTPSIEAKNPDWWEWLKRIISFFLIILLIIVLAVLIPPLGSLLLTIIILPLKLLSWLLRQIGKLFKKKE